MADTPAAEGIVPLSSSSSSSSNYDFHVMGTADDALKAKYAAVRAGYYDDPYISAFWNDRSNSKLCPATTTTSVATTPSQPQQHPVPPVQVIIKRGTYARVICMYKAISVYLEECRMLLPNESTNAVQVVVIGSGKDTTFFRILDERRRMLQQDSTMKLQHLHWFEVDHHVILQQKTKVIQTCPIFGSKCTKAVHPDLSYELSPISGSDPWPNAQCHLLAHHLNDDPESLVEQLIQSGLDPTAPTLIVLECVLMYMPKDAATTLLQTINSKCSDCICVSYEPILGHNSSFGRVMQANLTKVGVVHPTSCLVELRTVSQYIQELYAIVGCQLCVGCDMYTTYETIVTTQQRLHAQKCEFLDELEEFILIMQHYCFIVSSNNSNSIIGAKMCAIDDDTSDSPMGFVRGKCEGL